MPDCYPIGFNLGEDVVLELTVPEDLTGKSLTFVLMKGSAGSGDVLITKTTGSGGVTITDGPGGVCRVSLPNADTVTLTPATYSYAISDSGSTSHAVLTYGPCKVSYPQAR